MQRINSFFASIARNVDWNVRKEILSLPPLETPKTGTIGTSLLIATTPKHFLNALWTAYSFLYWNSTKVELTISIDGFLSEDDVGKVLQIFPNCTILNGSDLISELRNHPSIFSFCSSSRFGRKFAGIATINQKSNIIYCDDDILFFSQSDQIRNWAEGISERSPLYVVDSGSAWNAKGDTIYEEATVLGFPIDAGFNAGFFLAPKKFFDLELCDQIFSSNRQYENGAPVEGHYNSRLYKDGWDYAAEQSLTGYLYARSGGSQLSPELFLHSLDGLSFFSKDKAPYEDISLRHYVGPVRHRMYLNGMPFLLKKFKTNLRIK